MHGWVEDDVAIVTGIVEANQELAARFAKIERGRLRERAAHTKLALAKSEDLDMREAGGQQPDLVLRAVKLGDGSPLCLA